MNDDTQRQNEIASSEQPVNPIVVSVDGASLAGALIFAEREGGLGQEIQNPFAGEAEITEPGEVPSLDSLPPFDEIVARLLAAGEIDDKTAAKFLDGQIIPPEQVPELMRKVLLGQIPPD